jgi:hypothetical protein
MSHPALPFLQRALWVELGPLLAAKFLRQNRLLLKQQTATSMM